MGYVNMQKPKKLQKRKRPKKKHYNYERMSKENSRLRLEKKIIEELNN